MNRFYEFFGMQRRTLLVEADGGRFELKPLSEDTPIPMLWFTRGDIEQSTVIEDRIHYIAPIKSTGVACELRQPNGHQAIKIWFCEEGLLWSEKGFIIDGKKLAYTYKGELRMLSKTEGDKQLIDAEGLKKLGNMEDLSLGEDVFFFKNGKEELLPFDYFSYDGLCLNSYKAKKIAVEIMLRIKLFVAEDFVKESLQEPNQAMEALTWQAKTATVEDVVCLIALLEAEGNLCERNANLMLALIEGFKSKNKTELFTRYMEMFFAAFKNLALCSEMIKSIWRGKATKTLEKRYNKIYKAMYFNMDELAKGMLERQDFEELLGDYTKFEKAVREHLEI